MDPADEFAKVSALSSVASVLYNSYADFAGFGSTNRVNWAGVCSRLLADTPC